ncbi:cytochrome P450 [Brevundimonas mediterranea]|jgi:fatty-acid peroxygenase|uniref:Cytochrome P450 n=1 Tax=Brevundimonas mediterranea TaxID=74329 RepID=A0AB37EB88_9CAUL|nr:cytochrome P450 [Brevundimonas mediterranea]
MAHRRTSRLGDQTLALLADPYRRLSRLFEQAGADAFETRLALKETICLRGREAARVFYDEARISRAGAMPAPVRRTLLGEGGVQGLDGEAHRARKRVFMSLMSPERIARLGELFEAEWRRAAVEWAGEEDIVLYDALQPVLTRAVCAWAGVPLAPEEEARRVRHLRALFDAAGSRGPRHLWSRHARRRVDAWLASIIEDIRAGRLSPDPETASHAWARARAGDGEPLPLQTAAVELANVLRPTVATSVYIVFVAHAMQAHPEAARLAAADPGRRRAFVQEVRRFYPFFPAVIGRVRTPFRWRDLVFPEGRQVVLDLFGSNHDPAGWNDPEEFRPERFIDGAGDPFGLIPQGGGDPATGHRCPGESIVIDLMERAVGLLADLSYRLPDQDLDIDFRRLPALPRSGFRMATRDAALARSAPDAGSMGWPRPLHPSIHSKA